jgi:hypothetical protein
VPIHAVSSDEWVIAPAGRNIVFNSGFIAIKQGAGTSATKPTPGRIIEAFLADECDIDFVAVFSVKRAKSGSWDSSKNPRIWYLYVFEQKGSPQKIDFSRVQHMRELLPAPYLSGYEARLWHEQGFFSPRARGQYLSTTISGGKESLTGRRLMRITLS